MIVIITCDEVNKETGVTERIVSHGVDIDSGSTIPLPQVKVQNMMDAVYNKELNEYVLVED